MNIKKILFSTITAASLLSTGLVLHTNTYANAADHLNSYPGNMQGTWYSYSHDDKVKIQITQNSMKTTFTKHPKQNTTYYLHGDEDANSRSNTNDWVYAHNIQVQNSSDTQNWLINNRWNVNDGTVNSFSLNPNNDLYSVNKVKGKNILTKTKGTDNTEPIYYAYHNSNTAKKLKNKTYPDLEYNDNY